MSYLLDTDVLSEAVKREPDPVVVAWLRVHETDLFLSTITVAEIHRGIELLAAGKRKEYLRKWIADVTGRMRGRILSFDLAAAEVWGRLKAGCDRKGIGIGSLDSQIAAIALQHNLTLATHNQRHFKGTGVSLVDPFIREKESDQ